MRYTNNMTKKSAKKLPSDDGLNTDFWKEQRRKTLIESTGASMRLSGSKITNEEVEKIIDSERSDKKYMLLFVEEIIQNPKYKNWAAGRMEIRLPDENPHSINEVRFFTPRNSEWAQFVDKYNGKDADKAMVDEVTKIVKEKFYQVTE